MFGSLADDDCTADKVVDKWYNLVGASYSVGNLILFLAKRRGEYIMSLRLLNYDTRRQASCFIVAGSLKRWQNIIAVATFFDDAKRTPAASARQNRSPSKSRDRACFKSDSIDHLGFENQGSMWSTCSPLFQSDDQFCRVINSVSR